jgi:virginiamycin B lyase
MEGRGLRGLTRRFRHAAPSVSRRRVPPIAIAAAALVAVAAPAWAAGDLGIPNTSIGDPAAQLEGAPSLDERLTLPFGGAPAAGTGDTGSPEDDLAEALDLLGSAPDAAAAAAARTRALAILEGDPIPRKAYSGLPLLNWNAPAKVKTVPPGGGVTVNEVRFGDHVLSDTWLLDFADPDEPFTITYRVAEVGVGFGGVLAPTLLLASGDGQPSVLQTLAPPELAAGTVAKNRFHPAGAGEHTRLAVRRFTVKMPPPREVSAVVDPGVEPAAGATSLLTLERATPERLAAVRADFGFGGDAPTEAQRRDAIARLASTAPEKVLWTHLEGLDPSAPGFLDAARKLGGDDRALVGAMRSRYAPGVQTDASVDAALVLQNDEAYLSRRALHLAAGRSLTLSVTNADGFDHHFQALQLADRTPAFGALDWGRFRWSPLGDDAVIPAGATRTVTLAPVDGAYELWLGDPDSGDQAALPLKLDRAPRVQSLRFEPAWAHPSHGAIDAAGDVWVTLGGVDALAEVTPAADLADAGEREFPLPGGDATFAAGGRLDPHDIAVDAHGVVWATLADGNAIARLDPAQAHAGTSDGIRSYRLADCPACAPAFPVEPGAAQPTTRAPEQLAVQQDAGGNTILWYSEFGANAIGVLRVTADGSALAQFDVPCGCVHPKGMALGDDGSVWFTEEDGNRLGRLTMDAGPFELAGVQLSHYAIPSAPPVVRPTEPALATSSPHSVAVDARGLVWFSEEENAALGYLDPARARAGTSEGMTEVPLPNNEFREQAAPADLAVDRNGEVFFTDEYGDAVGGATAERGLLQYWRPAARQSLTDKPFLDTDGDLWFAETGANLLTRISGIAAPALPPAPPPTVTADAARHTVAATGLRASSSVAVTVERGGNAVAAATAVPVVGGAFSVPLAVRSGDLVRVAPVGAFPQPPLVFHVADVEAERRVDGAVAGSVRGADRQPGDAVEIDSGGGATGALVSRDGSFASPPGASAVSGSVTFATATRAGVFRTVVGFGPTEPGGPTVAPEPAERTATPAEPAPTARGTGDAAPADPQRRPPAATAPRATRTPSVAKLGQRALALVRYPWRRLGYRIVFARARPGLRAQTNTARRTIVIYVRTTDMPERIAHDIAHELGHAYDARFLRPRNRHAYLVLRGRPRAAWWPTAAGSDYASGAGDFAEVFALCNGPGRAFRSLLAPRPTHPCALVRRSTR